MTAAVTLHPASADDLPRFKSDLQAAFALAVVEHETALGVHRASGWFRRSVVRRRLEAATGTPLTAGPYLAHLEARYAAA